jgi:hypothetical protein
MASTCSFRSRRLLLAAIIACAAGLVTRPADAFTAAEKARPQSAPGQPAVTRKIGAISAINGNTITLRPDTGSDVTVSVPSNARLLRLAPGEKDLKNATPIQLQDLQVGDRILVGGTSSDAQAIVASIVVVMTHADLEAHQKQDLQDWQKRGVGGLVSAVDAANGTVTISIASFSGKKTIAVHTSKATMVRRYAPDSIRFEDAKPSTLAEIQPGDQLRARGDRSSDGAELTADEIVTGSFRNIAGTVNSVDASSGTIAVQDALSKKSVEVKITGDSQLHQIPPEMAQRIAMRLKASLAGAMPGASAGADNSSSAPSNQTATTQTPNGDRSGGAGGATRGMNGGGMTTGGTGGGARAGAPDFQQMLSRMPAVALADLHKGDAVMLVTTQGTASTPGTAVTLLSGVEPILQAAPNAGQALILTPWNLGGAPGGEGGGNP